ncbi:MAG TPA: hypothetical protein VF622_11755 [Segetibacter sp.]|jgi:hypothetical protein
MPFNSATAKAAGERSKRQPNKLLTAIRDASDKSKAIEIFQKLETMAVGGDMDAIKTYLGYVIGKPKESVDLTTDGEKVTGLIVEVIRREPSDS